VSKFGWRRRALHIPSPSRTTIGCFIIALAVSGQSWMVVAVVAFLIVTLGVVVLGLSGMLGEDDEEQTG
jgi:hypothetical protein